jgi:predicted DNA-binding transcriptional regulator AlpA
VSAETIPIRPPTPDPAPAGPVEDLDGPAAGQAAGAAAVEPLLVPAPDAARLCGVSEATWYRLVSARRCPAPVRLTRGCVRWRAEELREWIAAGCPPRREWEARQGAPGRPGGTGRRT